MYNYRHIIHKAIFIHKLIITKASISIKRMTLVTGQEDNICSMEKIICQFAEKLICRKKGRELRSRKIRKIRPGASIFQRPYLIGLFLEGLTLGGAYLRRDICGSKIDQASLQLEGILPFFFCFTLYLRTLFSSTSPRGLIFGGVI